MSGRWLSPAGAAELFAAQEQIAERRHLPAERAEAGVRFLMFGYQDADGSVRLYASRDLPMVEVETIWPPEDRLGFARATTRPSGPLGYRLRADLANWAVATGTDVRSALVGLGDIWGES